MNRSIDYSALQYPVPHSQVALFKANAKQSRRRWALWSPMQIIAVVGAILAIGAVTINLLVTVLFSLVSLFTLDWSTSPNLGEFVQASFPPFFAAGILLLVVYVSRLAFRSHEWEKWYRLETFATANGLLFSPSDLNPGYPGAIFRRGNSREARNHLRSASGRFFDMGNYRYVTGSGKSRTTHNWGFMALHLDRTLPHMVLDSTANNRLFGISNLPMSLGKDQVLSLEGDFDEHFTLYCPKQYEHDALYVFTPDLMALLIDNAAPFDVEIVDNWMFVYSRKPFTSADPAVYQRLFDIVNTVGAKTLSQSARYSDHRVGDFDANVIAPQGRRLKTKTAIVSLIIASMALASPLVYFIMTAVGAWTD